MDVYEVTFSKQAERDLKVIPVHIVFKLQIWIDAVKNEGLREIRRRPGFHDEPLKGHRHGQRSIRLNRCYRAIYRIDINGTVHLIEIIEVTTHAY